MAFKKAFTIVTCIGLLQGCVAAGVVAVVGGASVVTDNRTIGNQIDDQQIELTAHHNLSLQKELQDNTSLQVVCVNGSLLVVGQAPNTYLRDMAIKTLKKVDGITNLHNQIRISNTTSIATRTHDVWLTSKIKTAFLTKENLNATNIKVVTENGEVFLMGLAAKADATIAVDIARNISGVNRVYKMFVYQ